MLNAPANLITELYKSSTCPVIAADLDYSHICSNDAAINALGENKIKEILNFAKRVIKDRSTGSFVIDGNKNVYVESLNENLRVLHVITNSESGGTNALYRSMSFESQYSDTIVQLFNKIGKYENKLGKDFFEIEDDLYTLFALMKTVDDRFKHDYGIRERTTQEFDILHEMESIVLQVDLAAKILGFNVEFNHNFKKAFAVECDLMIFSLAIIKLLRGLLVFSEDKFAKVSFKSEKGLSKFLISVKSVDVKDWIENNLTEDDIFKVIRNIEKLNDGILITDAIDELKNEGFDVKLEQIDDSTVISIKIKCEEKALNVLKTDRNIFIGDPYSLLTALFTSLEKRFKPLG